MTRTSHALARRRLLPALALLALLAAPAARAQEPVATAAHAPAVYDDAAYWAFADRTQQHFDGLWSENARHYRAGGGGVDTSVNANLLLTHAVAALAGHHGAARNDHRARLLALRFLQPPTYVTEPVEGTRLAHAPGWTNSMANGNDQHPVYDADVMDALAHVYLARHALGLPDGTVEMLRQRVREVATSPFWSYPRLRLNQINWYILVAAANATVNGADRTLARDARARIRGFVANAGPRGAAAGNFGPGLRFHYLPDESPSARMNVDSAEYANVVLSFTRFYLQARRAGMPVPPAGELRLLRAWVTRAISGYWTHAGYLNWDSGLGFERWHQMKKLGLVQQALIGIAGAKAVQPNASYGRWAKWMLDQGFSTYARWVERGGGLAPALAFGVHEVPQGIGSARLGAARMQGNAARAVAAGLGRMRSARPPALYSYDPDIGRLAVTTPHYNTAIVAVNQGAFPYGGVELARLFDARQEAAGGIGGTPPASFGVWVRDLSGRRVMASQIGRRTLDTRVTPLRLVAAPRGTSARASSPVGRAFSGPFEQLRAVGVTASGGYRVITRHRFRPTLIVTRWQVEGSGRRGTVDVLFPSTGAGAKVIALLRDGRRVTVSERRIALSRIARFEIRSALASYSVTPLKRPRRATAHVVRPSAQSSAPDPGPTLGIQLVRAAKVTRTGFAARIRVN